MKILPLVVWFHLKFPVCWCREIKGVKKSECALKHLILLDVGGEGCPSPPHNVAALFCINTPASEV